MARVAFIQQLWTDHLGAMTVAAELKRRGHDARTFLWEGRRTLRQLRDFAPAVAGFTATTGGHRWCLGIARRVKEQSGCLVVLGGPHPTFFPEVAREPGVDAVCIGEGEGAMADLCDRLDRSESWADVPNLALVRRGRLCRNPLRPLVEDLDSLPFPDRSHYADYPFLARRAMGFFIAGRGCPHGCTFCFNRSLKKLYAGRGRYVRWRSPAGVLAEIDAYRGRYRLERLYFEDDSLTQDRHWLSRFLDAYRTQVGLPFHANVRAEEVDAEVAGHLRAAGCRSVAFGVESGSDRIRNEVLAKRLRDDQIVAAATALHGAGIAFKTYNILGLPGETLADAWQTVELNQRIGTDFPWCSVFTPYPRTPLGERCVAEGLVPEDFSFDRASAFYFGRTPLVQPDIEPVLNLQRLFAIAVKKPGLRPLLERLVRLPPNPAFDACSVALHAWLHVYKLFDMDARELADLAWRTLPAWMDERRGPGGSKPC